MGWSDVVGHDTLAKWFRSQLDSDRLAHAYLFEGPVGVGKKTMALALAQAVNCVQGTGDSCGECPSCRQIGELGDANLVLFEDVAEGLWVRRSEAVGWVGTEDLLLEAYLALGEAGFLTPPLPSGRGMERWDHLFRSPEKLYRRGELSHERVSDDLAELGGDEVSEAASRVGRRLYRFPRSVVVYRKSLGIGLVRPGARGSELRSVQGFLARKRLGGRRKVVIVDDAHKLTEEAQNCLLKTLEEPPEDSLLILVLDKARDVLPTIRSRCQVVRFGVVPSDVLVRTLRRWGFGEEDARWAAERSGGCLAAALGSRREESLELQREMLHTWNEICKGDSRSLLGRVGILAQEEIADRGARVRRARGQLGDLMVWLRDLLLLARGAPAHLLFHADMGEVLERESGRFPAAVLERVFWAIADASETVDRNVDLRLALEGTVLELSDLVKSGDGLRT